MKYRGVQGYKINSVERVRPIISILKLCQIYIVGGIAGAMSFTLIPIYEWIINCNFFFYLSYNWYYTII